MGRIMYTYLIGWSKLDCWYYGCRYSRDASPNDLWKTYFTSSQIVKEMRFWHGEPDVVQVRRIFKTGEQARRCEEKVLDKVHAVKSDRWLNKGNSGKDFSGWCFGKKHKNQTKALISQNKKGIPNKKLHEYFQNNPDKVIRVFGENNPAKRIEVRQKISQSKKGCKRPDVAIRNKTLMSDSIRQKISNTKKQQHKELLNV
jgi:NUMOD3 motif